jgi:pyruvate,water dikinase
VSQKQQIESVRWFEEIDVSQIEIVGGKNASLGEMIQKLKTHGIRVPEGFAVTAGAYNAFLAANGLDELIARSLDGLSTSVSVARTSQELREQIMRAAFPDDLSRAIKKAYVELSARYGTEDVDVAVRSSATAEDLPDASFAGQQDTFLNITGDVDLLSACRRCFASLFTERAITYRQEKGYRHEDVSISVGVQKMVRSDVAGAGVMFTLDTETGFPDVVMIDASWGLGESVVAGKVTPDSYRVYKPLLEKDGLEPIIDKTLGDKRTKIVYARGRAAPVAEVETTDDERERFVLTDEEVLRLSRWALVIERHYDKPMDIEWAKDGRSGELFIVQARPETVRSQEAVHVLKSYQLKEKGRCLAEGLAVGDAIATGKTFVLRNLGEADRFEDGGVLVTRMTDPDWVPLMRRAAAIVTDRGGRTSHAAIVSRELGVAAVIGTENAASRLKDGQTVTVSCAEGEVGYIYEGRLEYEETVLDPSDAPATRTKIMMNLASPGAALRWWNLPTDGVGLARMEFIINNIIKIHPLALTRFDQIVDPETREEIERLTVGYEDKCEYFVQNLSRGIAKIAAPHAPNPVIVRLSDFKTNEYANLIGGSQFEPEEENPMLGFRGASRYDSDRYRDGFALECRALKHARETLGLRNIVIMVPFCRTPEEADGVLKVMAAHGLERGGDLQVYCMAEVPSNVILAEEFAERFDGFSIGSNDLTQLVLGVDRDSQELASLFDERHEAVKRAIRDLIDRAHAVGKPVGICGQAPSDYPDFAEFLVQAGIDSISLNPDTVLDVRKRVAGVEDHGA